MSRPQTLAHISDLHFGVSPKIPAIAALVAERLRGIDHVVVTGDVTHRGLQHEYASFVEVFGPLLSAGKLTIVPGNHDRAGDNVADNFTHGARVATEHHPGLCLIKLDSTAPHNRIVWWGHGALAPGDLSDLDDALAQAPRDALVVVLMHHHPYPLPEEGPLEHLSKWVGLPFTESLRHGERLLEHLTGRVDLILHGHRHVPSVRVLPNRRPLAIYNAGSTTELASYRVFEHHRGRLCAPPAWTVSAPTT